MADPPNPTEVIQRLWEEREQTKIRVGRARDALERGLSFGDAANYQGHGMSGDLAAVIREALTELDAIPR